jgi:hypothetical protein
MAASVAVSRGRPGRRVMGNLRNLGGLANLGGLGVAEDQPAHGGVHVVSSSGDPAA